MGTIEVAREGTSNVRMLRLQLLAAKFENLKILEEATIEFNVCFRDIVNNSFSLGENMSKENLVTNIMRSLLETFDMKVTAIKKRRIHNES